MRRVVVVLLLLTPLLLSQISAQDESNTSFRVGAFNRGVFLCSISVPFLDFGRVDSKGTDYGTPGVESVGRNPSGSGAVYRTPVGAVGWNCRAAPPEKGDLDLEPVSAPEDGRGGLLAGLLGDGEIGLSNRLENVKVGNARFALQGSIVLELTVLDGETPGSPMWQLKLTLDGKGTDDRETETLLLVSALVVDPPELSLPVPFD